MKRKNGLTLMELLIVIGIIAILAGLIYAVLAPVRERAWIAYCVNSLKQVGNALHMYAQDHDGFVPPYTNYVGADGGEYFPKSNDPSLFEAAFAPYTKDKQIWYCPFDPYAGMDTPGPTPPEGPQPPTWRGHYWNLINHKATSYDIASIVADRAFAPLHIDRVPDLAQVRLINDQRQGRSSPPNMIDALRGRPHEYAVDYTHGHPFVPIEKHPGGIYLFFDGSVKILKGYVR